MADKTYLKTSLAIFAISVLSQLTFTDTAHAKTIYVDDDGPADFSNIQAAIDAAYYGDTIIVLDGTYTGPGNRDIDFEGKAITLRSESGPENCIIDCQGSGRGFCFRSGEGSNSVLDGFTITNGFYKYAGCAISCSLSDPTIMNCAIMGNSASAGAGLYCNYSSPTIINCIITANTASKGGGIRCWASNAKIINCTIAGNRAGNGGGISCGYLSRPTITYCTITGNSAKRRGGGVSCDWSYAVIKNSIIYENTAEKGKQLSVAWSPSIMTVSYSDIQGGQLDVYVSIYCTLNWGNGNIDADPCFIDPSNGNCRLLSSSPCIDASAPYYHLFGQRFADIDGHCRLRGSSVDMGSSEFGSLPDNDRDLLSDADEISYGSESNNPDTDGDGLLDGIEVLRGTSPVAPNPPQGISIPAQYSCIQEGLFLAFPLEQVTVSPGIYTENLHFQGKNVILQSNDPLDGEIVNNTIIDGNRLGTVITLRGTENASCILSGFTITNGAFGGINGNGCEAVIENNKILNNSTFTFPGNEGGGGIFNCDGIIQNNVISQNQSWGAGGGIARCDGTVSNNIISNNSSGYRGGGIARCSGLICGNMIENNRASDSGGGISCYYTYINRRKDPLITNCIIKENSAGWDGGGIFCDGGTATITNCTITSNTANQHNGGGICSEGCNLTIDKCTITHNSAIRGGGLDHCQGTISNCTISGNWAKYGGGLLCCPSTISNCTITGNIAEYGGGLYGSGLITNCIIWNNVASKYPQLSSPEKLTYTCIQNWTAGGDGNINTDPRFVEPGYWDANGVRIEGDYHLLRSSPCIDAGDPNYIAEPNETDLDGNARIANGIVDMGAYEYSPPIPAEVRIVPRTINLTSMGKWITCYIWLGEDYNVIDIDPNSIVLEDKIQAESLKVDEQEQVAIAKFNRSDVQDILNPPMADQVELTIIGQLTDGTIFEGTDVIRVLNKAGKN